MSSTQVKGPPAPTAKVRVTSMRRTCPWLSTLMVPRAPAVSLGAVTLNPYLVPVQPGPEAGPSSVTVPTDVSRPSRAAGLTDSWPKSGLTAMAVPDCRRQLASTSAHGFVLGCGPEAGTLVAG